MYKNKKKKRNRSMGYLNGYKKQNDLPLYRRNTMNYEIALNFVKALLNNFHLTFQTAGNPLALPHSPADLGLRQLLKPDIDYCEVSRQFAEICQPNTIYRTKDFSLCYYLIFRIPSETEPLFASIGPYTSTVVTRKVLIQYFADDSFPPDIFSQLEKYYQEVPYIADDSYLQTLIYTLGEWMWGSVDNFSIQDIPDLTMPHFDPSRPAWNTPRTAAEEPFVSMMALEKRYATEQELLDAVSLGQIHKADVLYNQFNHRQVEQRTSDPLRSAKNYAIVFNTLLRKAAQAAEIHPLYLDQISAKYANKIELCLAPDAVRMLQKEMMHDYCLLVQEHSLKGYSPLIQKALTQIDMDLSVDLSLYSLAKQLNVNASYLSSLFKKETGSTLTVYVNRKKVRHAAHLLHTTNMQIQTVAQYCGISDVNYFIRIFKKYMGKTPKEYRDLYRS